MQGASSSSQHGCAAPLRPDAALLFTDIVLKRNRAHEQMGSRLSLSDKDHVHAHAAASLASLIKYRLKPTAGSLLAYLEDADLLHAVTDADTAIDNGFRFAGAFEVAAVVLQLGEAHAQDVRGGARFGKYKQLWRAYDVRQRILEKMRHAPSRYTCAEPSCGFRSLKAHQFRRCAGPCSPEVKPGYCSKACQRKDWARHKAVLPQHNHSNCGHTHAEVRNH
ncbi:hypothetical protein OH76DRAFT_1409685 [Lentinus brumalis]|uniref:Uncharacterized protein n=1 Tax=Lentinus brumalis TaxID=2498619 RepID=A0A371CUB2_9APHY|nr:hypothetical protein OH76DRAFT_1409685 [Polyporus brumalis]